MCGLVAIVAYHPAALDVSKEELGLIRDHMRARGPDGKGEWISPDHRAALGHRRLAIIDPDERANQPMASTDGRYLISYNGEIYNYKVLRKQLLDAGCALRTESDTEVLLELFARKGEAMLAELRGMFAISIWDQQEKRLFLARDAFGIKPLYYADDGWTLRAASQVKALLAGGKVSKAAEPAGIVGFHLWGSVPEPFTSYQEIRALAAGHYLWVDALGASEPKAWCTLADIYADAARKTSEISSDQIKHQLDAALLDSVQHHLVADVPVGAFLSAGIDSGALVGLMRDAGQQDIQTITLAFEEFRGQHEDEAPLAQQVADYYGTRHQTRWIGRDEFEQDLPLILEAMDQPSIDGINSWFVSKAASELGLKVALSGLGGDELFGGYPSFTDVPRWVRGLRIPGSIPLLGKALRATTAPVARALGISPKAAGMLELGDHWEGAYLLRRGLFMPWELDQVLDQDMVREGLYRLQWPQRVQNTFTHSGGEKLTSPFARVACMESALYMRNQLLRDADWAGMAHSLEIRVPLVDAKLLKTTARLATQQPLKGKQRLATAPAKPLPEAIAQRAKSGFTTPIDDWMTERADNSTHWSRTWCQTIHTQPQVS